MISRLFNLTIEKKKKTKKKTLDTLQFLIYTLAVFPSCLMIAFLFTTSFQQKKIEKNVHAN